MIFLAMLGCDPGRPPVWEALDLDALEGRLENPTATVQGIEDRVEEVALYLTAADRLAQLPQSILRDVLATPTTEAPPVEAVYAGTTVFVQVGCPGPGTEPDPDFAHGYLELDSPLLVDVSLRPLVGPLFLQFRECALDDLQLDGEVRARWMAEDERLVASGELILAGKALTLPIDTDLDVRPDFIALSVPMPGGRATLTLDAAGSGSLRFADATLGCSVEAGCEIEP